MKFVLSQLNYTIGALEENAQKMAQVVLANKDTEWVVFSELSLTGYYPKDLINVAGFYDQQQKALDSLLQATRGSSAKVVFGAITPNPGPGKRWYNSLLVAQDGRIVLTYSKQLLPTYDVYDEYRHFEPGPADAAIWREAGKPTIGFVICEDGWNDHGGDYERNPTRALAGKGVDILVSINASPAAQQKPRLREKLMVDMAKSYGWSLVYVNQVGGNDSLVFDGNSFVCRPDGSCAFHAPAWEESTQVLTYNERDRQFEQGVVSQPKEGPAEWLAQSVLGVRDYFRKTGHKKALVGMSGGIDSALVGWIAAKALGPENVTFITMPSAYSSEGSISDSAELAANLGVKLHEVPIAGLISTLQDTLGASSIGAPYSGVALENSQARMRGLILMCYANQIGALLLTTGNKSEMSVGYATLYGDMSGALNPIGDLYKMEVYKSARWINEQPDEPKIPQHIIDKAPSAELAPGQKDEDSLPPYPVLDAMLRLEIEGHLMTEDQRASLEKTLEGWEEQRKDVLRKMELAEFKRRQAPPIIRLHPRAFGDGWEFPVAQQYRRWERM